MWCLKLYYDNVTVVSSSPISESEIQTEGLECGNALNVNVCAKMSFYFHNKYAGELVCMHYA